MPDRARLLWCTLASAPVAFAPSGVAVVVTSESRLRPPGWCGRLSLGESAIAVELPADDPEVAALLTSVPPEDASESGLDEITSSAFVSVEDGRGTTAGWEPHSRNPNGPS
jgi:hypothetical protein